MIQQLSERQEEARGILEAVRTEKDHSFGQALLANLGYDDDLIIAVTLARLEMTRNSDREIFGEDLVVSGGILDHLDTLGYRVVRK